MPGLIKMVVFDLDGVLTKIESSWQAVHTAFGVNNEAHFQKHVRDEIDYREFMRSDIRLWGRCHISRIQRILEQVPLMDGSKETIACLKREGIKTAIISSGISLLAERVKLLLGIDYAYANRLITDGAGYLVGEGEGMVTLKNKDLVLESLCRKEGLETGDCAVVGDSRFDVPLFERAGLSIAFNPHDLFVEMAADIIIKERDLRMILPWVIGDGTAMATISLLYESEREADTVVRAVSPDNLEALSGLAIRSFKRGRGVKTKILCVKGVGSLLRTIDDFLVNVQIAEKTLKTLQTGDRETRR